MIKGHLDLLLLGILAGGPQHGYAVIASLRERSDGRFDLPEGTVYPALHKLEADDLVTGEWTVVDGRRRRRYALTAAGEAALVDGRRQWRRFRRGIEAVVGA